MESDKNLFDDGKRQMRLCNACRYCEGYCAVWQAIEWRRDFDDHDMTYLANLCHDCGDCYYACPFTTPHQFGINPPKLFAQLREKTYQKYTWPVAWGKALGEKISGFWIAFLLATLLFFGFIFATNDPASVWQKYTGEGSFYALIPEYFMIGVFSALGLWMIGVWLIGARKFWRDIRSSKNEKVMFQDIVTATKYAMSLRYLGGEGEGCADTDEEPATNRRWLHHFVGYGFLLTFASTSLAAFYAHILHIPAPYPVFHPVVILGTLGGVGMIIGTTGLLYLKLKRDPDLTDEKASKSGASFIMALWTVNVTGMLLLIFRETAAMNSLLVIHLGSVAAFFFTAPYTKFVHFVYRYLALVNYANEERLAKEEETAPTVKNKPKTAAHHKAN
ncbi:citrate/tricarballylate utilization protein [Melghiribacillus thermohalophilus]|uniref:Citrate/tricarballylate utilization protein n=1 Tax=Melghiribacillus thermohalophilus TaxID=1324956 RepID=A0A4R3N3R2_9BACI|nr:tricarballylate utilization 4Fe-4S protein TcuB [Melghiribacillus thermohalophilus]TCT21713.1 citrate/tricarballylate utilization protein [Melghiribacillus thermohalophilus]